MRTRSSYRYSAIAAAVVAAGILNSGPASAAVVAADGAPALTAVRTDSDSRITVDWTVRREIPSEQLPGTISSDSLQILIGGTPVATLPRALSRTLPGAQPTQTLEFRETVRIPRALIFRAVKQGDSLRLVRTFNDSLDGVSEEAGVEVAPGGRGSLALTVRRLELSFDDGARTRIVPSGDGLRVVAELNATRAGLVSGIWEVATGAAVGEEPAFRPLALVHQGVGSSGRSVITSPRLPTGAEGSALVRFRVTDPQPDFATPTLQYYVTPPRPDHVEVPPREILLVGPSTGEPLGADTRFAWTAVAGATAYQIAFHAAPDGPAAPLERARFGTPARPETLRLRRETGEPALAGTVVPGERNAVVLQGFTLAQLPPERSYLWQVTAFDDNGAVIGSSALREIYKP